MQDQFVSGTKPQHLIIGLRAASQAKCLMAGSGMGKVKSYNTNPPAKNLASPQLFGSITQRDVGKISMYQT